MISFLTPGKLAPLDKTGTSKEDEEKKKETSWTDET